MSQGTRASQLSTFAYILYYLYKLQLVLPLYTIYIEAEFRFQNPTSGAHQGLSGCCLE